MPEITNPSLMPVERAAHWLAKQPVGTVENTLPTLMKQFDLSAPDAMRAIKRAKVVRAASARRLAP